MAPSVDSVPLRAALGGPLPVRGAHPQAVLDQLTSAVEPSLTATVGPKDGRLVKLQYTELSPAQFRDVLDREIADAGGAGA